MNGGQMNWIRGLEIHLFLRSWLLKIELSEINVKLAFYRVRVTFCFPSLPLIGCNLDIGSTTRPDQAHGTHCHHLSCATRKKKPPSIVGQTRSGSLVLNLRVELLLPLVRPYSTPTLQQPCRRGPPIILIAGDRLFRATTATMTTTKTDTDDRIVNRSSKLVILRGFKSIQSLWNKFRISRI